VATSLSEIEGLREEIHTLGVPLSPTQMGGIRLIRVACSLCEMGNIYEQLEQYNTALHHYTRSLDVSEKVGDNKRRANAL
jgi:hypothetical protein